MRSRRETVALAALLVAAMAGCQGGTAGSQASASRHDAAGALKPVTIPPAPSCELGDGPASRPKGTVIGIYHTANVVGEVDPCG